ncbi:MAG: hypothetical protein OER86_01045 [Phycisphaerae bacterium]|nr:hypothetical protein [Phycisphaerae bacterium]
MQLPPLPISPTLAAEDAETSRGFWEWLLNLRELDFSNPDLILGWQHPMPAWVWAMIILGAGALAAISYRRILGRRGGRILLAGVRSAVLLFLMVLIARPILVLPKENVEVDHLLMLVDRSASLTVKDAPLQATATEKKTRHDQLRWILRDHEKVWQTLATDHHLDWVGFSDQLEDLPGPLGLEAPKGQATALRTALHAALRRLAGKPIGAVILFSDGRSNEPLGPETWQVLRQSDDVKVFVVPLGSPMPPRYLTLGRIDAPDRAFINDAVPIKVMIDRVGAIEGESDTAPAGTVVRLIDQTTGAVLDEQPVRSLRDPVRLLTSPKAAGEVAWVVQLVTPEEQLVPENNRRTLELTLVDRPIRLLYVEGYPRWEYRYLKNLVIRETSISSSVMLMSADRAFAQEGNVPLRRLPQTAKEMEGFDVIVIGDVPSTFFSAAQLRLIQDQVAKNGAGLMWIGGPHHTPSSFAASPIGSLLPMSGAESLSLLSPPVELKPTRMAEGLGVLHLRDPAADDTEESAGLWPQGLPPLMWAQSIGELKLAAEPLAVDAKSEQPLIVRMRFGAGQSLYVGTDEIWRWRYGRGELYPEQYWMQLFRLLARGRLQAGAGDGGAARLIVSHRRAATGDTLVVELRITDQALLEQQPETIEVEVAALAEPGSPRSRFGGEAKQTIALSRTDDKSLYRGLWSPRTAARYALRPVSASVADLGLEQVVEVERADDELRFPATDHALLAELAKRTTGTVLDDEQLPKLPQLVPNRARRTPADVSEPLWNTPLAFGLLLLLLTCEWVGRKALGLA